MSERTTAFRLAWCLGLAAIAALSPRGACASDPGTGTRVERLNTPGGGIQPQALIDPAGAIHLVYYQGPPSGGDLAYVRLEPGGTDFSAPIRVNSRPGSAVAMGTIRGAQVALGRGGRLHVAWNGTPKALPANPLRGAPMLYTRSDPGHTAFEPQRNLMQRSYGLDGGGTVAADDAGNVYVAWHGKTDDDPAGESGRRVWVARSGDDGASFAPEEPASQHPTGACPCCGMRALALPDGGLFLLFRAATGGTERGMILLTSRDRGATFAPRPLHPWRLNICPMSSATMSAALTGPVAAWETNGQVYFARIGPEGIAQVSPVSPPGDPRNRKHPAIAVNRREECLLAWAEGTAWQRGGTLAWQLFDPLGRPIPGASGRVEDGIPTWSLPTVVARPEGGFVIIH